MLRTTFITGFPGETEKDHAELVKFVKQMKFERAGVFAYSEEEGTPAATMGDQVPEEVKQRRRDELMSLIQDAQEAYSRSLIGQDLEVAHPPPSRAHPPPSCARLPPSRASRLLPSRACASCRPVPVPPGACVAMCCARMCCACVVLVCLCCAPRCLAPCARALRAARPPPAFSKAESTSLCLPLSVCLSLQGALALHGHVFCVRVSPCVGVPCTAYRVRVMYTCDHNTFHSTCLASRVWFHNTCQVSQRVSCFTCLVSRVVFHNTCLHTPARAMCATPLCTNCNGIMPLVHAGCVCGRWRLTMSFCACASGGD